MSLDTLIRAMDQLGREGVSAIMAEVQQKMEVERPDYLALVHERDAILDRHLDADVRSGDFTRLQDINQLQSNIAREWQLSQKTDAALEAALAATNMDIPNTAFRDALLAIPGARPMNGTDEDWCIVIKQRLFMAYTDAVSVRVWGSNLTCESLEDVPAFVARAIADDCYQKRMPGCMNGL